MNSGELGLFWLLWAQAQWTYFFFSTWKPLFCRTLVFSELSVFHQIIRSLAWKKFVLFMMQYQNKTKVAGIAVSEELLTLWNHASSKNRMYFMDKNKEARKTRKRKPVQERLPGIKKGTGIGNRTEIVSFKR